MFIGILLASASALLWAVIDAQRKILTQELSALFSVILVSFGAASLFGIALCFQLPQQWPSARFFGAAVGSGLINVFANLLFFRAVQISPLSLTVPFLSFTPVFMLLSGALWLGELPNALSSSGLILVILGAFQLSRTPGEKQGIFRTLLRERGSVYMLGVAFLWSHTGPLEKIALQEGSTMLICFIIFLCMALPLSVYALLFQREAFKSSLSALPTSLIIAATMFLATISQMFAFQYLFVVYVDTIKRSGAIFAVLIGYFYFKERPLWPRLLGASLMVMGTIFMLWASK